MSLDVAIWVLGPDLEVWRAGRRVAFRDLNQRRALTYLALHYGRPIPSSELEDALWTGTAFPKQKRSDLQTLISRLKSEAVLGAEAIVKVGGRTPTAYSLAVAPRDLQALEDAEAALAAGDMNAAIPHLVEALSRWQPEVPPFAQIAFAGDHQQRIELHRRCAEGLAKLDAINAQRPVLLDKLTQLENPGHWLRRRFPPNEEERALRQVIRERVAIRRLVSRPGAAFDESLIFLHEVGSSHEGDRGSQIRRTTVKAGEPALAWRKALISSADPEAERSLVAGLVRWQAYDDSGARIDLVQISNNNQGGRVLLAALFPAAICAGETRCWRIDYEWPGYSAGLRRNGNDFHVITLPHVHPYLEFVIDLPENTEEASFESSPPGGVVAEQTAARLRWVSDGIVQPNEYRWDFAARITPKAQ